MASAFSSLAIGVGMSGAVSTTSCRKGQTPNQDAAEQQQTNRGSEDSYCVIGHPNQATCPKSSDSSEKWHLGCCPQAVS
jgi:hypothetical protein